MSTELLFRFDEVPSSVNNLYFSRGGRRIKSDKAKRFVNRFVSTGGGIPPAKLMDFEPDNDVVYELHLWFYLSDKRLFNARYGSDGRVKSPFNDLDASNLIKLAEDSIAKLLGLRDRNNWSVCAHKRSAEDGQEYMVALIRPLSLTEDPYPCPDPSTTG
jgi:hypothetical protein